MYMHPQPRANCSPTHVICHWDLSTPTIVRLWFESKYSTFRYLLTGSHVPFSSHPILVPRMVVGFSIYQLAFLTPGKSPDSAFILKLYCSCKQMISIVLIAFICLCIRRVWALIERAHTLDILKSLKIPLPLPPKIHRFLIWVGLV